MSLSNARFVGIAPMKLILEFSGTPIQFILMAEEITAADGGILDSRDMGDAMGVIISECMNRDMEFTYEFQGESLIAAIEFDSFQWNSVPLDFGINLDRLPPSA